jgi:putative membrane protein insertion efficiency factor
MPAIPAFKVMIRETLLQAILFYQRWLSPLKAPTCRFYPSCSSYAFQAFEKHGVCRGLFMTLGRIVRCHPLHPGGYDPVR